ncbi:hypothetical protein CYY_008307 [Polysphondylium violaceum]|uniref:Nucleoside diphosphate-linked moiety X motif 6 n=1 Tax=Polysphondylium violaceum TaxID=133409 RepID=A0A8J4UXE5_9MYCE|nr:hypothetical protein CYY_008307 [Polysphondylium violaceum]
MIRRTINSICKLNILSFRDYHCHTTLFYSTTTKSSPPSTTNLLNITKEMSEGSKTLTKKKQEDTEKYNGDSLPSLGLLKGTPDIFDGLTIDEVSQYPDNIEEFRVLLKKSLDFWIENKRRGLWFKVPESKSQLIPVLIENGFKFHHCQSDYLMLTNWLPQELNKLPHYTSHFIGCGGVVINDKKEILLITEKQRPTKWKIPGGALDSGEDISATAVREVFEETGVKTEFVGVLGFRQLHKYAFNRGDIYYICALKPISEEINIDPNEIALCKWAPIEEFLTLETPFPLQRSVARLAYEYAENGYKGFKGDLVANSLKPGNSFIYHGSDADLLDLKYVEKHE